MTNTCMLIIVIIIAVMAAIIVTWLSLTIFIKSKVMRFNPMLLIFGIVFFPSLILGGVIALINLLRS